MPQYAAEAFAADNLLVLGERLMVLGPSAAERPIGQRLMRTQRFAKLGVTRYEVVEMFLAEDDEVMEALDLDRLDPPLGESILIRGLRSGRFDADAGLLENGIETGNVHPVQIADEVFQRQASIAAP